MTEAAVEGPLGRYQGILTVCQDRSVRLCFIRWVSYSCLSYTNTLPPQDLSPLHHLTNIVHGAEHLASAPSTSLIADTVPICLSLYDIEEGRIQINKVAHNNL